MGMLQIVSRSATERQHTFSYRAKRKKFAQFFNTAIQEHETTHPNQNKN